MKETMRPSRVESEITRMGIENGTCTRCLSESDRHSQDFYGRTICNDCARFGLSTSHTPIFRHERDIEKKRHVLALDYPLSADQMRGSRFFQEAITEQKGGFLEAVCGAGKTEMLFQGFIDALNRGMRICFAIPRKQIVIEIAKRLESAFPDTIIKALHGDAKDDAGAHLVVSTIHQLISYYQEFDLLVVDEVDAFPLCGDPLLNRLLHKCLKPGGVLFLMSATTNEDIIRYRQEFGLGHLSIERRFHNQPLPVPEVLYIRNLMKSFQTGTLPDRLKKVLEGILINERIVFCFVPTIALAHLVHQTVSKSFPNTGVITSKTQYNPSILRDVSKEKINLLISTSILERGVTYSKLDVIVLFADHEVYSRDMLVQIAGRVGRKIGDPYGTVLFATEHRSDSIDSSIELIRRKNDHKNGVL